jgi:penicillin-binding protein 2
MRQMESFRGWRLTVFQGIIFAVFVVFGLRLVQWQFIQSEQFIIAAADNRLDELPLPAPRGIIIDRNGQALAVNVPAYNVLVTPAGLPAEETEVLRIYNVISALTSVPPTAAIAEASGRGADESIERQVAIGAGIAPYRPVTVARDVGQQVALQLLEQAVTLPGVDVQWASVREYPTGALTAHIIGYMGRIPAEQELELIQQGYDPAFDRIGYAGLESFMEEVLAGERGVEAREVDVAGLPLRVVNRRDPTPGISLRLTLNVDLQRAAEAAVRNRLAVLNAEAEAIVSERGVVIAMNPQTGEVLAMVSYPDYDNSRFARAIDVEYYLSLENDPLRPLLNQATQALYPPGSTWKVITSLGVLGENIVNPNTFLFDGGDLLLENRYAPNDLAQRQRFVCWLDSGHGQVDLLRGIAQSCNVYFYQIGGGNPEVSPQTLRAGGLGPDDLWRYALSVGIASPLGLELPFLNRGAIYDRGWKRRNIGENWSTGDTYNAAVGQGYIQTTPLHMAAAFAAIANGGTLYQPTLIRDYLDANGNVIRSFLPRVLRNVTIDNLAADELITLLPLEDMIMKGPSSLVCTCEPNSPYYNPVRCNPATYRNQVDVNPDPDLNTFRQYRVSVPENYSFSDNLCLQLRFDPRYRPAFSSTENFRIVQEGMRQAVTVGTAERANLNYVTVAGKTGTAEYCDNIANARGLCVPGNWPSHAWFAAYAPYENPEIMIIGFVYNGDEGSRVALPMVMETMEAYFRLVGRPGAPAAPIFGSIPEPTVAAPPAPGN